jgi:hypothetical protein
MSAIATANKMEDIEEIENFYEREIEKADKEFLNSIRDNKDLKNKEAAYKESLDRIHEQYQKKYDRYLKIQKENLKNKPRAKAKKEKKETLNITRLDFRKIEKKENKRLKKELFWFNLKMKIKKIRSSIMPKSLIVARLKAKLSLKSLRHELSYIAESRKYKIMEKASNSFEKTKDIWKTIASKISKFTYSIRAKLKRKKESKSARSEEEQLLDKILNKEEAQ